jgi:hypothetical protein
VVDGLFGDYVNAVTDNFSCLFDFDLTQVKRH